MEKKIQMKSFENIEVSVIPDKRYGFLMTTTEVAKMYGISPSTIRGHKFDHKDELIKGKHFITVERESNGLKHRINFWTKRGVIRMGFFIASAQTKLFRDPVENLVIITDKMEENGKHNRLTRDRLVDILADVARIEDKELRLSLVEKLLNQK